jgi:site-specific DNA recombinase
MDAMYLRKSRAEELTDTVDETLKRHRETLLEFAVKNNLAVNENDIYEEVVSGESLYARPEMLRLLENVEKGKYEGVLCMDIDRLGRGAMSDQGIILETLKAAGTKIITPRKIYDLNNDIDETYSEFETFMARQELKAIKRRMQRGIKRTIEDGGYIANAPYGYRRAWIDKCPTLEIVDDEAKIIRMMFDLYVNNGYGCQRIADTINALGAKPRRSEQFVRVSVMKILKNPTYIGKIAWNQKTQIKKGAKGNRKTLYVYHPREKWTVVDGMHKPIVDEDLFSRAQEIIAKHTHPPANTGKLENPLAGLVFCAHCGAPMQRQVIRRGGAFLGCVKRGCMVSSSLPMVEKAVLDALRDRLESIRSEIHPEASEALTDDRKDVIEGITAERQTIQRQIDKLRDLLEQGVYTIEVYLSRQKLLTDRLKALDVTEERLLTQLRKPDPEAQFTAIKSVLEIYDEATPQERNELLKSVIDKVVYNKEKGARPDAFQLEIFFSPYYF